MRWMSALLASLVVALIAYFLAIPYFGAWFGLEYLPPDKQRTFTASMLALAVGSGGMATLIRRPAVIFIIMWGGAGIGNMVLLSLSMKASIANEMPPTVLKGGAAVGSGIGFCIAFGSAILSLLIAIMLEQWLLPKFAESRNKVSDLDPLMSPPPSQTPPPPKTKKYIKHKNPPAPALKWIMAMIVGIILIPISKKIEWPQFGSPSLDPHYQLMPSVWDGAITYKDRKYIFTLVFEEVDQQGKLLGYMDWPAQDGLPHIRLLVEGTATGNHLEFEDTEYIIGVNTGAVYDKKDVWISGKRMTGTDKNGTATFDARKTSLSPPSASATTAVGFRAHKKALVATWGKHMRVCQDLDRVEGGRLVSACWSELAKEAKEVTFCMKTSERDRFECAIDVLWDTGDWQQCQTLSYEPIHGGACVEMAATLGGDAQICEWYRGPNYNSARGYSSCLAVVKRDPEACAKISDDPHSPPPCWYQLAIALQQPQWCEHAQLQKSGCYSAAYKRLHIKKDEFGQVSSYDRCESFRAAADRDACFLKRVARGDYSTTCLRIETETLRGTCSALPSL